MLKFISLGLLIVALCFFGGIMSFPAEFEQAQSEENFEPADVLPFSENEPQENEHHRFRRATCDLLSISTPWGSVNHAACAAHCLALNRGFRGGYCSSKAVCTCRK
uniref:Defensin n=1 Tax=Simulium bannaense TaxID=1619335 RepID=A0A0C5IAF5_9DIPT|nr:defensin precursor [Simulium bannaense]